MTANSDGLSDMVPELTRTQAHEEIQISCDNTIWHGNGGNKKWVIGTVSAVLIVGHKTWSGTVTLIRE